MFIDKLIKKSKSLESDPIEEKRIEEKFRESKEEIYKTLIESSNDGIVVLQDGKIIFANKKIFEVLNYKKEEIIGKSFIKFLQAEYRKSVLKIYLTRLKGGKVPQTYEVEIITKEGKTLTCEISSSRIIYNSRPAVLSYIRVIEERKKMLENLRKSEAIFEGMISSLNDLVFMFDKQGRFIFYHTPTPFDLYKPSNDFIGKEYSKVMPPYINELIDKAIENNKKMKSDEFEYCLDIDGKTHWYSAKLSPMFLNSEYTGSVAVAREITEHKKTEESLKKSEEKFRGIFESANDCLIYMDIYGRIIDVNKKTIELFGGSKEELLGKHFTKVGIFSFKEVPKLMSNFAKILSGEKNNIEISINNKKGQEIFLECSISFMKLNNKPFAMAIIARDVTEGKKTEEALKKISDELTKKVEETRDIREMKRNLNLKV